ncbi:unnamed protein product, partial [Symbiodinium sp. CCMP2456]
ASPDYFWDPAGSPAPTSTLVARVPEVELTWMARQCVPGFYSAIQNVVINMTLNILFDVFLGACLGVVYMWYITLSMRNRMMHIVYGNMGQGRKGKSKGAAKGDAKGKGKAGSDVRVDAVAPSASITVRCGLSVMGSEGIRTHTEVDRFLVQLGFGEAVLQNMRGVEAWLAIRTTSGLSHHVRPSASFLLHSDFVDVLLKSSGKRGSFFKTGEGVDMELLWLPEGFDLVRAIKLATHDTCYGVVEKGGAFHPRFAIRFRSLESLRSFAKANNIVDLSAFGRWKLSGIHASTGLHGVAALLQQLKWLDVQILYLTEGHAVFLASNRGWDDPAFFRLHGTSRQLIFKALNSQARGMARDGNARSSVVEEPKTPMRSLASSRKGQSDFLAKVFPQGVPKADEKIAADPEKRQAIDHTGETPEPQRMVNGNTQPFRICYLNADGFMGMTRGPAISALPADVIAISETHLTADLLKLVDGSFPRFRALWGAPSQAGVGFLVRDAAVWTVRPIQWTASSPCHRHFIAGRLHGISLYLGNGKKQLLCYVIYGHSGARWSSQLKKRTHNIVEAVLSDAASRGLPAIFGGDINLEVSDSDLLQRLPQLGWSRLADAAGLGQAPTCFKGGGSVIDHMYCNQLSMASFTAFFHGDRMHFADHNPLFGHFNVGVASQVVFRNRHYTNHPVDGAYAPLSGRVVTIHHTFSLCLQRGDVDSAFRYWNQYAEKHLSAIIVAVANDSGSFQHGRGTVRVDPQPLWPPSRCGDVASLAICRLWKQCCRMVQLQKQTFGELARRTWYNAARGLSDLSEGEMAEARRLLSGRCLLESVVRLRSIFEHAIVRVQREQKHARIASWKAKLQSSVRAQHTWLRNDGVVDGICFQGTDGQRTANVAEQFEAVREAWKAVNELFKDGVSSPGLDGWSYPDLKILAQYAPWVFDELWPDSWASIGKMDGLMTACLVVGKDVVVNLFYFRHLIGFPENFLVTFCAKWRFLAAFCCPLSMIALNAVINIWLKALNAEVLGCKPRAYADDVSVSSTFVAAIGWKLFGLTSCDVYCDAIAMVMDGLLVAWRAMKFAGNRAQVKYLFYNGAAVLRLLLTGGLFTRDLASQHKTKKDAILENGHYIVAMMGGGVWCRKCGTFVREPKHRYQETQGSYSTKVGWQRNGLHIPDTTNFWDPAGFTADGSVENFKRRRQTELKHGRTFTPDAILVFLMFAPYDTASISTVMALFPLREWPWETVSSCFSLVPKEMVRMEASASSYHLLLSWRGELRAPNARPTFLLSLIRMLYQDPRVSRTFSSELYARFTELQEPLTFVTLPTMLRQAAESTLRPTATSASDWRAGHTDQLVLLAQRRQAAFTSWRADPTNPALLQALQQARSASRAEVRRFKTQWWQQQCQRLEGAVRSRQAYQLFDDARRLGRLAKERGLFVSSLGSTHATEEDRLILTAVHSLVCDFWNSRTPDEDLRKWHESLLFVLYKGKGGVETLENFRGVVSLDIVYKLVSRLLNSKLVAVVEQVADETELGYRRGRGVTDAVFCARRVIESWRFSNPDAAGPAGAPDA